jgi:hypothetical protein
MKLESSQRLYPFFWRKKSTIAVKQKFSQQAVFDRRKVGRALHVCELSLPRSTPPRVRLTAQPSVVR